MKKLKILILTYLISAINGISGCADSIISPTQESSFLHSILEIGNHGHLNAHDFISTQLGIHFQSTKPSQAKTWYGIPSGVLLVAYEATEPSANYSFIRFRDIKYIEYIETVANGGRNGAMLSLPIEYGIFCANRADVHEIFGVPTPTSLVAAKNSEKFLFNHGGESTTVVFTFSEQTECLEKVNIFDNQK